MNRNTNLSIVKCRDNHTCGHCNRVINRGESCLTVNSRQQHRRWYCNECVSLLNEVNNAKLALENVVFDDEGGVIACQERLDEAIAEFESVKK